jgi:hypothetical protein
VISSLSVVSFRFVFVFFSAVICINQSNLIFDLARFFFTRRLNENTIMCVRTKQPIRRAYPTCTQMSRNGEIMKHAALVCYSLLHSLGIDKSGNRVGVVVVIGKRLRKRLLTKKENVENLCEINRKVVSTFSVKSLEEREREREGKISVFGQ